MAVALTQMGKFYGLPVYINVGLTDSKIPDAQAGIEARPPPGTRDGPCGVIRFMQRPKEERHVGLGGLRATGDEHVPRAVSHPP
jgi:hypothetical protein